MKEVTTTDLVLDYLRASDDLKTYVDIQRCINKSMSNITAALSHLKKHRSIDFVVDSNGTAFFFALPPEEDTRCRIHHEREKEEKPRRRRFEVAKEIMVNAINHEQKTGAMICARPKLMAEHSVEYADALMEALEKPEVRESEIVLADPLPAIERKLIALQKEATVANLSTMRGTHDVIDMVNELVDFVKAARYEPLRPQD